MTRNPGPLTQTAISTLKHSQFYQLIAKSRTKRPFSENPTFPASILSSTSCFEEYPINNRYSTSSEKRKAIDIYWSNGRTAGLLINKQLNLRLCLVLSIQRRSILAWTALPITNQDSTVACQLVSHFTYNSSNMSNEPSLSSTPNMQLNIFPLPKG